MKIYEGVITKLGDVDRGKRFRVVGPWQLDGPTGLHRVEVRLPCGNTRLIYEGEFRPLNCDERPAYIENPEAAFAPVSVVNDWKNVLRQSPATPYELTDARKNFLRYVPEMSFGTAPRSDRPHSGAPQAEVRRITVLDHGDRVRVEVVIPADHVPLWERAARANDGSLSLFIKGDPMRAFVTVARLELSWRDLGRHEPMRGGGSLYAPGKVEVEGSIEVLFHGTEWRDLQPGMVVYLQAAGRQDHTHFNCRSTTQPKKDIDMKTKKHQELLAALQTDLATVACTFVTGAGSQKPYTYKVPKSWGVAAGDRLVVDTPTGLGIVEVREVHKTPQLDGGYDYKWAVQVVSTDDYRARLAKEEAFLDELAEVERLHAAQEMVERARSTLGTNTPARRKFDKAVKGLQS